MGKMEVESLINQSNKIAVLSGAGVSTLSGIKDFRGTDGLYKTKVYGLTPERILSSYFFTTHRELFYKYYMEHMVVPDTLEPNTIHQYTKQLSDEGKLVGVITQNIDGLYQKTGLPEHKLVEFHGNGNTWVCIKCKKKVSVEDIRYNTKTGNYFSPCHDFIVRPDIVLYDEMFSKESITKADEIYRDAGTLVVMGTLLDIVYHKDKVRTFKGSIILVNDTYVDLGNRQWDAVYLGNIQDVWGN